MPFLVSFNKGTMNGYSFKEYKDFPQKWKLVTVRFRKDIDEMRFVYANELAFKALQSGTGKYPDGAIFGKLGVRSKDDPEFASSMVPSGVHRYQLMVKNSKKT